jgi:hypothetical protein
MSESNYTLRNLTADDIFPMFNIISKIGIKEFKGCFEAPDVKNAIGKIAAGGESSDLNAVGLIVALDMANILMTNLPKAKDDIYQLLSQVSGMNKKEIAALPMSVFMQMIIDLVRKEDFADFFQVVSKLFKPEK